MLYSVLIDLSRQTSQPILVAIFVTIAMVKVELIRDFLHFDYFTNKTNENKLVKTIFIV